MSRFLRICLVFALSLGALPALAHEDLPALDLAAYRGKVVYLDFWASWCTPCARSFPFLDRLQTKYLAAGLVVIGVNVDTERKLAAEFLRETPVGFKIVYDPEGKLAEQWQVPVMPSAFLIGRDGKTRSTHTGFRKADESALEATLVRLLGETTP